MPDWVSNAWNVVRPAVVEAVIAVVVAADRLREALA